MTSPTILVRVLQPTRLAFDLIQQKLDAVARPGDVVNRLSDISDQRLAIVRLLFEERRRDFECEALHSFSDAGQLLAVRSGWTCGTEARQMVAGGFWSVSAKSFCSLRSST